MLDKTAQLGLLVVFLVEQIEARRRDLSAGANAGYLRTQVVGLVARKWRITGHLVENKQCRRLLNYFVINSTFRKVFSDTRSQDVVTPLS